MRSAAESALKRRTIRARGQFPTGQAALTYLYLVSRSLAPVAPASTIGDVVEPAINAFAITFGDDCQPPNPLVNRRKHSWLHIPGLTNRVARVPDLFEQI
ncbi:hypothetical protein GCM10009789_39100 [Kribbella sancticallisti]|uniref:Uncharacterized protein n=1 Tax=Kribbella sancticallisti TaxID=460087 RepID=A0ABP4PIG0_9ACTN